jgi:hypothetical protein
MFIADLDQHAAAAAGTDAQGGAADAAQELGDARDAAQELGDARDAAQELGDARDAAQELGDARDAAPERGDARDAAPECEPDAAPERGDAPECEPDAAAGCEPDAAAGCEPDAAAGCEPDDVGARRRGREMHIRVDTRRTSRLVIEFARRRRAYSEASDNAGVAVVELAASAAPKRCRGDGELAPPIPLVPGSHVLSDASSSLTGFTGLDNHIAPFEDRSVSESRYAIMESFFSRVMRAANNFSYRALL